MHVREIINEKLGFDDGSNLLDPDCYPPMQLEEDRFDTEIEQEQAKERAERLKTEKEDLKEQGVGAPPSEKQALATEIESIDMILQQEEAAYQEATDELALLRVVEGIRRRMNTGTKNYEKALSETSQADIKKEVREVARDLDRDAGKINSILKELKISTRITTSSKSSNGKSKYVEEMERREDEREYKTSSTDSARSGRDRSRS